MTILCFLLRINRPICIRAGGDRPPAVRRPRQFAKSFRCWGLFLLVVPRCFESRNAGQSVSIVTETAGRCDRNAMTSCGLVKSSGIRGGGSLPCSTGVLRKVDPMTDLTFSTATSSTEHSGKAVIRGGWREENRINPSEDRVSLGAENVTGRVHIGEYRQFADRFGISAGFAVGGDLLRDCGCVCHAGEFVDRVPNSQDGERP